MVKLKNKNNLIIFLCWLVYTSAYLGRYSYNSNITIIENAFGIKHTESGLVTTFFFMAYGIGQFLNGMLCKHYNKKIMLPIVLFISATLNLLVFFGIPFTLYKYLWFINGIVQSVLWPSIIMALSENVDNSSMNKSIIVMSTTTSVGTLLAYSVSAILSISGTYKWSFLVGGIVLFCSGLIWLLCYDNKNSLVKKEVENTEADKDIKESQVKQGLTFAIIMSIIIICSVAVVNNLVKDGLNTWVPAILKENFNLGDSLSIVLTIVLPILGIFGAILSNYFYKLIKNFIALLGLFFAFSVAFIFLVILLLPSNLWFIVLIMFGFTVMIMHGINNVVTSMYPMYMRKSFNSGKVAGIINGFCYVGSTISSYGLGAIADAGGWNAVCYFLLFACIISVVVCSIYFLISRKRNKPTLLNK